MSSSVVSGSSRETRLAAPSCSAPAGSPPASRSIRPSAGSAVAGVDPGPPQRGGVDPGAVPVPVGEERGPAAGDGVQRLAAGQAAGEGVHRPSAAGDPLQVRVGRGVAVDDGQVVRGRRAVPQVAAAQLPARVHRVHVGVDKAGQQRPAAQVDQADPGQASAAAAAGAGATSPAGPTAVMVPPRTRTQVPGGRKAWPSKTVALLEDDLFASDRHSHLRRASGLLCRNSITGLSLCQCL